MDAVIGQTVERVRHLVDAFAVWVRTDYPQRIPRPGHVALVALCGQESYPEDPHPQSSMS
jgi:hypothetical protein